MRRFLQFLLIVLIGEAVVLSIAAVMDHGIRRPYVQEWLEGRAMGPNIFKNRADLISLSDEELNTVIKRSRIECIIVTSSMSPDIQRARYPQYKALDENAFSVKMGEMLATCLTGRGHLTAANFGEIFGFFLPYLLAIAVVITGSRMTWKGGLPERPAQRLLPWK
jgi:hypothetical protein